MGFEPTTPGTTIQCSNQLSYNHHVLLCFPLEHCKGNNSFSIHQHLHELCPNAHSTPKCNSRPKAPLPREGRSDPSP